MSTHGDHAAMIGRLSVSAVEKSGEVFREASTALKLTQRLDKRSFFVVEDLDVEAVLCGERRFENDAEIVSRGASRISSSLISRSADFGETRKSRSLTVMLRFLAMGGRSLK